MTETFRSVVVIAQYFLNRLAVAVFALAALGLTLATALAASGVLPWLEFQVSFGGQVYENAGQIAQIGLTVLAVLLCFYLPANARVMALENSHRRFHMNMQDVTQAYAAAHAADRAGMFQIQSEFDAVRERLAYMREHPDLESLEPQIMEVAAQMSYISRELAEIYSDDKVDRARAFLKQRQQEVEQFNKRLDHAKAVGVRLKQWAQEVEMEESVAVSQLERLRDDLRPILPELGYEEVSDLDGTVVGLPNRAAE
ncbi:DNA repair protein [Roseovarius sp.]|uniref:DNA repair protein n=1 Tax=Roseovarius sp. TaxID=1486281 RepID=UPI003D11DCFC